MLRIAPVVPHPVIERMRYNIPAQITDWARRFSGKPAEPAKPAEKPKRKAVVRKTTVKKTTVKKPLAAIEPRPAAKPEPGPEGKKEAKALVFIKKEPITFQVRRLETPGDFERMAFVTKACSNDPNHKPFMVLHVEQIRDGSWLIATDGKRLHAALTPAKIRSGDYKPMVTKDIISLGEPVTGIMFPNWRRVIPGTTVQRGMIDLADSSWGKDRKGTERLSIAFNTFVRQTGELVNLRYLEDLAKKKWSIHCQREKNRAIMLKAEGVKHDMFAVLMPLIEENVAKAA
jgi:hypothetical protein